MDSYFWVGEILDDFLFQGLNTRSWQGLLGLCAVLTAVAVIYEGLHVLKLFFLTRFINARKLYRRRQSLIDPAPSGSQPSSHGSSRPILYRHQPLQEVGSGDSAPAPRSHLEESDNHNGDEFNTTATTILVKPSLGFLDLGISSVFHSVYVFLGFTLMNAVMTFNVWVLVAISIGVAIGYFCLGNYRREENLISPLSTETTSLNEDSSTPPLPSVIDGIGDRCVTVKTSRTPALQNEHDPDGESSRLIVGAEVHTPRIMSTSTVST